MMRNLLLKVVAPAALAIGALPAIASAHGHAYVRYSYGCGAYPYYYPSAYYTPAYVAPAPVIVTPAPCYTAPEVVVTPPVCAPVVVYRSYPRPFFYSHVHYWRR